MEPKQSSSLVQILHTLLCTQFGSFPFLTPLPLDTSSHPGYDQDLVRQPLPVVALLPGLDAKDSLDGSHPFVHAEFHSCDGHADVETCVVICVTHDDLFLKTTSDLKKTWDIVAISCNAFNSPLPSRP